MTEELLNTVVKLYESNIRENGALADNIVLENGFDKNQEKILKEVAVNVPIGVVYNSQILTDLLDLSFLNPYPDE
jgi:hypothetical protein